MVGDDDAPLCEDGVCQVPDAPGAGVVGDGALGERR